MNYLLRPFMGKSSRSSKDEEVDDSTTDEELFDDEVDDESKLDDDYDDDNDDGDAQPPSDDERGFDGPDWVDDDSGHIERAKFVHALDLVQQMRSLVSEALDESDALNLGDGSLVRELHMLEDMLPTIMLIGGQSSGKSSVQQALSGVAMPASDDGMTSKMPVKLYLRRRTDSAWHARMSIKWNRSCTRSRSARQQAEAEAARVAHMPDGTQVGQAILDVQQVLVSNQTNSSGATPALITDAELELHVEGPQLPSLNMIDLPGLQSATELDRPIRNMVTRFLKRYSSSSIVLHVFDLGRDWDSDAGAALIREVRPKRVLVCVNKADAAKGSMAEKVRLVRKLHGQLSARGRGRMGVVFTCLKKLPTDIPAMRARERYFFTGDTGIGAADDVVDLSELTPEAQVFVDIPSHELGVENLAGRLQYVLMRDIQRLMRSGGEGIDKILHQLDAIKVPKDGSPLDLLSDVMRCVWRDARQVLLGEHSSNDRLLACHSEFFFRRRVEPREWMDSVLRKIRTLPEDAEVWGNLHSRLGGPVANTASGHVKSESAFFRLAPEVIRTWLPDCKHFVSAMSRHVADAMDVVLAQPGVVDDRPELRRVLSESFAQLSRQCELVCGFMLEDILSAASLDPIEWDTSQRDRNVTRWARALLDRLSELVSRGDDVTDEECLMVLMDVLPEGAICRSPHSYKPEEQLHEAVRAVRKLIDSMRAAVRLPSLSERVPDMLDKVDPHARSIPVQVVRALFSNAMAQNENPRASTIYEQSLKDAEAALRCIVAVDEYVKLEMMMDQIYRALVVIVPNVVVEYTVVGFSECLGATVHYGSDRDRRVRRILGSECDGINAETMVKEAVKVGDHEMGLNGDTEAERWQHLMSIDPAVEQRIRAKEACIAGLRAAKALKSELCALLA